MLPASVTVMEVSPRDGLQNEDVLVSTAQKLQLIDHALASGSKRIEVTSFVHLSGCLKWRMLRPFALAYPSDQMFATRV